MSEGRPLHDLSTDAIIHIFVWNILHNLWGYRFCIFYHIVILPVSCEISTKSPPLTSYLRLDSVCKNHLWLVRSGNIFVCCVCWEIQTSGRTEPCSALIGQLLVTWQDGELWLVRVCWAGINRQTPEQVTVGHRILLRRSGDTGDDDTEWLRVGRRRRHFVDWSGGNK